MSMIRNVLPGGQEERGGTTDVVAMLEADHRKVEQLFKAIQAAESRDRSSLVDRLGSELGLHMAIEESLVYPRVSSFDREMSEEAKAEHELARKVLRDLQRLSPDEPGFDGALEMVRAGIQHHVQEEEQEVLPKLRQQLGDAEMGELTEAVRSAKERGRAPRRSATAGKGSSRPGRARTSSSRSSSSRSSSASKSPSRKKSAP